MKIKMTVDGYRCLRCGYEWIPKKKSKPRICPGCHSPYWDRPRKNKRKKELAGYYDKQIQKGD